MTVTKPRRVLPRPAGEPVKVSLIGISRDAVLAASRTMPHRIAWTQPRLVRDSWLMVGTVHV